MYRQSIRRHRRLLLLPILIGVGMALWTVAGSAKQYEATVGLWVDTPPPSTSSLIQQNLALAPPADSQQQVVQELLSTRSFRLDVGHRSPLAAYLASGPSKGWGPTGLLSAVKSAPSVDDQILHALDPKRVTITVAGPQVLQLSFRSTSPAVAAGTLKALVTVLNEQLAQLGHQRNQASLGFYRGKAASASQAVQDARDAVARYLALHPGAQPATDPQLRALIRAQKATSPMLARATTKLNQASAALQQPIAASHVSIIDQPSPPTAPLGGKKKLVMAVVGGGFVGAVISFLLLIVLAPSRPRIEVLDEAVWDEPLAYTANGAHANGHVLEAPVDPFGPAAAEST